MNSQIQTTAL